MHSSTSENPSGNLAHIFPNEFRLSRKKYVSYFKRFVYEVSPVELRMERCENAKERANERIQWEERTRSPRAVKFRRVLFFKASQISARFSLSLSYSRSFANSSRKWTYSTDIVARNYRQRDKCWTISRIIVIVFLL